MNSIVGSLGVPAVNGVAAPPGILPVVNRTASVPIPVLPGQLFPAVTDVVGSPTECLMLKNLFDPATEVCKNLLSLI